MQCRKTFNTYNTSSQRHTIFVFLIWVHHAQLDCKISLWVSNYWKGQLVLDFITIVGTDVLQDGEISVTNLLTNYKVITKSQAGGYRS